MSKVLKTKLWRRESLLETRSFIELVICIAYLILVELKNLENMKRFLKRRSS